MQANFATSSAPAPRVVETLVRQIFTSRQITRADQQHLMGVLLAKEQLSLEDQRQINRVFDGLRQGLIRVAD